MLIWRFQVQLWRSVVWLLEGRLRAVLHEIAGTAKSGKPGIKCEGHRDITGGYNIHRNLLLPEDVKYLRKESKLAQHAGAHNVHQGHIALQHDTRHESLAHVPSSGDDSTSCLPALMVQFQVCYGGSTEQAQGKPAEIPRVPDSLERDCSEASKMTSTSGIWLQAQTWYSIGFSWMSTIR